MLETIYNAIQSMIKMIFFVRVGGEIISVFNFQDRHHKSRRNTLW
jgi:hypothetical protein